MDATPASTIARFLRLLYAPGDVFEVRAPKCASRPGGSYASTVSGYFTADQIDQAAAAIAALDSGGVAPGIYVTLNPVRPDLLARAANRLRQRAAETTGDREVERRRWLLIDLDPVRPAGVSATDAELALSRARMVAVREQLDRQGWPAPVVAMSGNGHHLLYRIDMPPDDAGVVQCALAALADRFGDDHVHVDRSVHNPARIVKVSGTMARKGDDLRGNPAVADRPHRRSAVLEAPDAPEVVPAAALEELAAPIRPSRPAPTARGFPSTPDDVRAWLESRGVAVKAVRRNGAKTMLLLERCPVNPEIVSTGSSDIAVLVGDDGVLAYCNLHDRGAGYTWHDLRAAIDPEYGERPTLDPGVDLTGLLSQSAAPVLSPPQPSAPRSARQLLADHPLLRPPVIVGLLRRGETMNVISAPKLGKSWLVLDLAMAVATGRKWLSLYETIRADVLIIDNELHAETSAHRIPQVAAARDIGMDAIAETVYVENLRGRLQDIHSLHSYFESVAPGRFGLVVLDAFYRFMPIGGDENDNGTMANIYNRIDAFAERLGCSFILIHHTSKGSQSGKSVTDVGAGAGSQSRATDTHLVLRPHEETDAVVLEAAARSWPPVKPLCLRWSFPVWELAPELDPTSLATSGKRADAGSTWTAALFAKSFITPEPARREAVLAAACKAGVSKWRATCLLREAEAAGLVLRQGADRNRQSMYVAAPPKEVAHGSV